MKIPEYVKWKAIGETLGSGGQGIVEVVVRRDESDGPRFALKALRNNTSMQARERFVREIKALQTIDHPYIAKVVDFSKPEDDFQYYVMDYYEGAQTLAKRIFSDANPFHGDALASLRLTQQVARAIAAYGSRTPSIVHRDIKPENILVLKDGTIRIIDFGICQIGEAGLVTLVDEGVGSRNYAAPECESGAAERIDVRADIYSLGKVLWSMMTSRRAFAREAPAFTNSAMTEIFPNRPKTWHLVNIFSETIRRRPDDRLPDGDAVGTVLQTTERLIERGFPPLERVAETCPSCGYNAVDRYSNEHLVFGNPNPSGVVGYICIKCGFIFARNVQTLQNTLNRRKKFD